MAQKSTLKTFHPNTPVQLQNSQLNRITFCYFPQPTFQSPSTLTSSHANQNATSRCYFFYFPIQREFDRNSIFK